MTGSIPRRILLAAVLVTAGTLSVLAQLSHVTLESSVGGVVFGAAMPMALSLLLVGAGAWLSRSEFEEARVLRLGAWVVLGGVGGLAFGFPIVPYQATYGISITNVPFVVVTWVVTGALGGFLIGVYDARQRRYSAALRAERAELAARERELERENERLETFASILSHDLRNPLNAATGHAQLAHETDDLGHLEAVLEALARMETIVADVLTMVREGETIREEELETVRLADVAATCWKTFDAGRLTIEADVEFRADASRVKHVFENLYRNAIEHGGDSVAIRVGPLPTNGFYIEDDGSGVPERDRERVFDPGYTTNAGGTGYGLYIVKTIVGAHGWTVTIAESEAGGARFEFTDV